MEDYPFISLCMPIFERNNFIPLIINNLNRLDYPKEKLEFIIDDDGINEKFKDWNNKISFEEQIKPIKLKIYEYDIKREIGTKRNNLVKKSTHKLISFIDSDDLYMSNYLKHSLEIMKKGKYGLVGANSMLFCYPHLDFKITGIQCTEKRMIHEASMMFTKKHWKATGGFQKNSMGEGTGMVDGMIGKNVGLTRINECMLCLCHNNNTIKKDRFIESQKIEGELSDYDKGLIMYCLNKL